MNDVDVHDLRAWGFVMLTPQGGFNRVMCPYCERSWQALRGEPLPLATRLWLLNHIRGHTEVSEEA